MNHPRSILTRRLHVDLRRTTCAACPGATTNATVPSVAHAGSGSFGVSMRATHHTAPGPSVTAPKSQLKPLSGREDVAHQPHPWRRALIHLMQYDGFNLTYYSISANHVVPQYVLHSGLLAARTAAMTDRTPTFTHALCDNRWLCDRSPGGGGAPLSPRPTDAVNPRRRRRQDVLPGRSTRPESPGSAILNVRNAGIRCSVVVTFAVRTAR